MKAAEAGTGQDEGDVRGRLVVEAMGGRGVRGDRSMQRLPCGHRVKRLVLSRLLLLRLKVLYRAHAVHMCTCLMPDVVDAEG